MANTKLREEWERRITVFRSSGQTQVEWCRLHNLNVHQLKYWIRKIEGPKTKTSSKTNWLPITMEDERSMDKKEALIVKIGVASIEVKPGFNPTILADVVRTLKSIC